MRILLDEEGLGWDEAWEITTKTVLTPTIRSWQRHWKNGRLRCSQRLLPRIYQIVDEINRRFCTEIQERYPGDDGKVARMAIIFTTVR